MQMGASRTGEAERNSCQGFEVRFDPRLEMEAKECFEQVAAISNSPDLRLERLEAVSRDLWTVTLDL